MRSVTLAPGMVTKCDTCGTVVRVPDAADAPAETLPAPGRVSLWRRWLGNLTADTARRQNAR